MRQFLVTVTGSGEAGLSPAQVLMALLILAVVALVIVVALRRVAM